MKTNQIRNQIETAIKKDQQTNKFGAQVRAFLQQIGQDSSGQAVNELVSFVYEYLRHVPEMTTLILREARKQGIQAQIQPMFNLIEEYFVSPNDLIPDNQGILGILDDAYFAMFYIQSVNNLFKQNTGLPLISLDFTQANQVARTLLGQEISGIIEMAVSGNLSGAAFNSPFNQLLNYYNSTMFINDPIWGTASVDDVVNARLGAMGIF